MRNEPMLNQIEAPYRLSPNRRLTEEEQALVWKKPASHKVSVEELRICQEVKRNWHRGEMKITNILLEGDAGSGKTQLAKALSADFGLPYTKVTCFADMDKSDIIGAILPVIADTSSGETVDQDGVDYRFYPSEIVNAYQHGYLLEIQEPTMIRDAGVLMALNSALELDGSLNLPTGIIRRHPDFIAIITTNRSYAGVRPLNEVLRDRVQHTEKMDLPTKAVMVERAMAKTGYGNEKVLKALAEIIVLLDQTARAQAMKGIAGMRSFLYWADAVAGGAAARESLYHKVIYKITTDPDEIRLLEEALERQGKLTILNDLQEELGREQRDKPKSPKEAAEIKTWGAIDEEVAKESPSELDEENAIGLKRAADSEEGSSGQIDEAEAAEQPSSDSGEDGPPRLHPSNSEPLSEEEKQKERDFRKRLNQGARGAVADSTHKGIKLIVHRPEASEGHEREYDSLSRELMPVILETARKVLPLLEHELSAEFAKHHYYGGKFQADSVVYQDFRYFAKKLPPHESPSLVVGLRVDESASMSAFGRLEAAKRAALAVYEFCHLCGIPVMIYGDTADISKLEMMSIYAYADWDSRDGQDRFRLLGIRARSNNRDGMALRVMADRLAAAPQMTKLLISISDGQPKAMPDYTGGPAIADMQRTIAEFERKGVAFLAAAIGQDKEVIQRIYGNERFLDITDLKEFPAKLVRLIARYL